ncbi:MAG: DUF502 domain-containing protein [Candidatus Omnitrophota bacterium]|nr:DUF502 domain-containing protein [Candidatus Omnitrophota bacterium]
MWIKIRNNFFAGIAIVLPLVITIFILKFIVVTTNNLVLNPALVFFKTYLPATGIVYFKYLVKGLVLCMILALIILVGFAAKNIIIRRFFSFWEKLLYRIPLVNKLYMAMRQISNAFLIRDKSLLQRVVLLEYPRKGIYSIGFVTSESYNQMQKKISRDIVNVFVPTAPNPTSGILLLVPRKELVNLDMSIEEGLKLVISVGSVIPSIHR